jgi:mannose-1-phosphate guanylyltransferase
LRETSALLLAAGLGARLRPYTEHWPKCLMPVQGRPLLEYWFSILHKVKISNVLVNTHYHSDLVMDFLHRPSLIDWVKSTYEKDLLGTAGTLRANKIFFRDNTILLAHADNLCCCDFSRFLNFHHNERPKGTVMTMMTFKTPTPATCGIVEIDKDGVVQKFHEKVLNPPSDLANAAVYLLEPEIIDWILQHPKVSDFSTEVLPHFVERIATWKNAHVLRDIGSIDMLKDAQSDNCVVPDWPDDSWNKSFLINPIHQQIL